MSTAPDRRRRPTAPVVALAGVLAALLVGLTVAVELGWGWAHRLDTATADDLNRYVNEHHWQVGFWQAITNGGQPTVFRVLALVAAVILWVRARRTAAIFTLVAVEATSLLSTLSKVSIDRARPHVAHPVSARPQGLSAGSYPSGHALTSAVAVGVVVVLLWPVLGRAGRGVAVVAAALVAGLVGFSRLILGVHFVTDVLAAWLLGALWLLAVTMLFRPTSRPTLPGREHRIGFRT